VNLQQLKALLDAEALRRNEPGELSYDKPDPVLVARRHPDERAALVCALFGYGRADTIVAFLDRFDFSLLDADEAAIRKALSNTYYRFQCSEDVIAFFIALRRLGQEQSLEAIFKSGYDAQGNVIEGINALIGAIRSIYPYESQGYGFLVGREAQKLKGASPFKRWLMYLRWMVRHDAIDMGLWQGVRRSDLLIPLDTHTFRVSQRLGLLKRKSYDLQAALELTQTLKSFDPEDPVRYDFALYRMGQEKIVV
jgi:uncharacterized protein (TIGR02757 family)